MNQPLDLSTKKKNRESNVPALLSRASSLEKQLEGNGLDLSLRTSNSHIQISHTHSTPLHTSCDSTPFSLCNSSSTSGSRNRRYSLESYYSSNTSSRDRPGSIEVDHSPTVSFLGQACVKNYTLREYSPQKRDGNSESAEMIQQYSDRDRLSGGIPTRSLPSCSADSTTQDDIYTCNICHVSFPHPRMYTEHLFTHAELYRCQICAREYKQARDYRAHMATHTDSNHLQCDICLMVLPNTDQYLTHLKVPEKRHEGAEKARKKVPNRTKNNLYLFCSLACKLHGQKDFQSCKECGKYFRDKCTLRIHMRTHTGEKPYTCDICKKRFRQSGTFKRHLKVHSEGICDSPISL